MHPIACAQNGIDHSEPSGSEKHEFLTSEPVDGIYRHKSKYHIGDARKHYVEQHLSKIVAGIGEYLLGIVENDVSATPLLEYSHSYAEPQHQAVRSAKQHTQSPLSRRTFLIVCISDCLQLCLGISATPYLRENIQGFAAMAFHGKPPGTLRDEEHKHKEQTGGERGAPEHPAPSLQHVPGIRRRDGHARGHRFRYQIVHDLRAQDTQYDCELVERNEFASYVAGSHLGYIHRGKAGSDAYRYSTHETRRQKISENIERSGAVSRDQEYERRQ